jgi:hypothetical protein
MVLAADVSQESKMAILARLGNLGHLGHLGRLAFGNLAKRTIYKLLFLLKVAKAAKKVGYARRRARDKRNRSRKGTRSYARQR